MGLPGLEIATIGPHGLLPAGTEGELVMRGPGVFVGYLGQDDLYAASLTPEGFFRTGDLAKVTADGYLRLTGRLKDLIIRGGVNLSPVPLEDALASHPKVRRVAVIGRPDDRLGERLCAVVVPAGTEPPRLDDLIEWVSSAGLPRRLWPESLELVADMPQTAAGKIRKHDLRKQLFGGMPA
jgi:acyl-CoA synthetase (AMP-forming)/AMP-acid ligase II